MKKSNTLAKIAAIKQFEKKVLKNTKSQCMKETSTLANIAALEQLKTEILRLVIMIIMEILRQIY